MEGWGDTVSCSTTSVAPAAMQGVMEPQAGPNQVGDGNGVHLTGIAIWWYGAGRELHILMNRHPRARVLNSSHFLASCSAGGKLPVWLLRRKALNSRGPLLLGTLPSHSFSFVSFARHPSHRMACRNSRVLSLLAACPPTVLNAAKLGGPERFV